jgi:hypothetical protein
MAEELIRVTPLEDYTKVTAWAVSRFAEGVWEEIEIDTSRGKYRAFREGGGSFIDVPTEDGVKPYPLTMAPSLLGEVEVRAVKARLISVSTLPQPFGEIKLRKLVHRAGDSEPMIGLASGDGRIITILNTHQFDDWSMSFTLSSTPVWVSLGQHLQLKYEFKSMEVA